jgi:peptide-methionine (S)-S-oxide reductase
MMYMEAIFGAGCFWCVEDVFRQVKGVKSTVVGYAGGWKKNPTYEEVCTDTTGHAEVVKVEYDPEAISYKELLDVFWRSHDPTTLNRQGPDIGTQYRSVIFYYDKEQEMTLSRQRTNLKLPHDFQKKL